VRSWGGWVRNGIKITIQKLRLYKFIRPTFSQPLRKFLISSTREIDSLKDFVLTQDP
jgi:hypothetical protein